MRKRSPVSISIETSDGEVITGSIPVDPDAPHTLAVLRVLGARNFDACPISGGSATTDEHIPPYGIGGLKLTRTCARCNNTLGGYVEAELCHWVDHAIALPRFSATTVRGNRRSSRLLVRETSDGKPFMCFERQPPAGLAEMLSSGQIDVFACAPDMNKVRIALLKQLYLAACLASGIPEDPLADQIRGELIAVRDAKTRDDIPFSVLASGVTFCRLTNLTMDITAPVVEAVATNADGPVRGLVLGGRVFVSWTLTVDPRRREQPCQDTSTRLTIGAPTSGVVTAVRH